MVKQKTLRHYSGEPQVYLDATELMGYSKKVLHSKILKTDILKSLNKYFAMITSDLAKYETVINLMDEKKKGKKIRYERANKIVENILNEFGIFEVSVSKHVNLTEDFLILCARHRVKLCDGIHLAISAILSKKMVTYDQKLIRNKRKFYPYVYSHTWILKEVRKKIKQK